MYLCKLNSVTGLIDLSSDQDGFYAIPEFRKLLSDTKLGLQKLTCVALVVDYSSPIRQYHEKEKPLKAMDNVLNDRKAFLWNSDEIQEALLAYQALQHDLDLEEDKMLRGLRFEKQMQVSNEQDISKKLYLMQELQKIKNVIADFENQTAGKDLFENSPVRNGYSLSRLEQKLENKKSFYHVNTEKRPDGEADE